MSPGERPQTGFFQLFRPLSVSVFITEGTHVAERRIEGFFYGLFMDVKILKSAGANPVNPRPAFVDHFALRIGNRATLIPSDSARAYGMLIALTHAELDLLYRAPGLETYRPEAVLANVLDGSGVPALCYNLIYAPKSEERNPDYALKLQKTLRSLNFPPDYIESIR